MRDRGRGRERARLSVGAPGAASSLRAGRRAGSWAAPETGNASAPLELTFGAAAAEGAPRDLSARV